MNPFQNVKFMNMFQALPWEFSTLESKNSLMTKDSKQNFSTNAKEENTFFKKIHNKWKLVNFSNKKQSYLSKFD